MDQTTKTVWVVEVGNTRIKSGRFHTGRVQDFQAWDVRQAGAWSPQGAGWLYIAGPNPKLREAVGQAWQSPERQTRILRDYRELPIFVEVQHPETVGHDRLLNALGARHRYPGEYLIVISAGTAITVDCVSEQGSFLGGSILPGLQVLAMSLHQNTALLPLVEFPVDQPAIPGKNTREAIQSGIFAEAIGGVIWLVEAHARRLGQQPRILITGGDAERIQTGLGEPVEIIPTLTLEGLAVAFEPEWGDSKLG